jgi:hypothetical protein
LIRDRWKLSRKKLSAKLLVKMPAIPERVRDDEEGET